MEYFWGITYIYPSFLGETKLPSINIYTTEELAREAAEERMNSKTLASILGYEISMVYLVK